tara:strand:+ start:19969 stop:20139 length:171 start_codon:yes stop_codon:yes gene_type:complete
MRVGVKTGKKGKKVGWTLDARIKINPFAVKERWRLKIESVAGWACSYTKHSSTQPP